MTAIRQQTAPVWEPTPYVHDFRGSATVLDSVVHALSDATGMTVSDAHCAIESEIDTESLNHIFRRGSRGTLTFAVYQYTVVLWTSGHIDIRL